jgi:hypothetical protein
LLHKRQAFSRQRSAVSEKHNFEVESWTSFFLVSC